LELFQRSAWLIGSDAIALRALDYWRMGDHGIGDYLNASCGTLQELLETCTQYVGLLHDGIRLSLRVEDNTTHVVCEFHDDVTQHYWYMENTLGKLIMELRRVFGGAPIPGLMRVAFAHSAPKYEREYAGAFRVPVDFSQGENALVFQTVALETVLPTAD